MNTLRNALLALGLISSLILVVAGVVGYLLTGPPPVEWSTSPGQWSWYAARELDRAVEDFQQRIDEGSPGDRVSLVLSEGSVQSKVNELAAEGILPEMRDICILFDEGLVKASFKVDLIIDVQVAVETRLGVENNKPRVAIQRFYLGRLPIPKTLTDNVIAALMRGLDKKLGGLPIELVRIRVGDEWILVTGEVK